MLKTFIYLLVRTRELFPYELNILSKKKKKGKKDS